MKRQSERRFQGLLFQGLFFSRHGVRSTLSVLSVSIIIISALCLTMCGGPGPQKADRKAKPGDNGQAEAPGTDAVPVQVASPEVGSISSFLLFSSNIDSDKVVDIYPMTTGIIREIRLDEGDEVKKDGILAVLDDREAAINEKKAHISYLQLKADFHRQEEIYRRNMLSKENFEQLKFSLDTAHLDWKYRQLMLSYTRITSPIAGVVSRRHIKVGNKINTGQPAFSVVQDREKIAVVNIPEQEKNHLFVGQDAEITTGETRVRGRVARISPAIDPQSGTFKVTVTVNDPDRLLAIGRFVNVKIIKKVHNDAVLITREAVLHEGGKVFVFVIDAEGRAIKKPITLGFEEGNRVEITGGINAGDQVVTAGKSSLKNNTLVKIIQPLNS